MGRGIDYGGEEYNQGLPESDVKQKMSGDSLQATRY
jgi:hypothetical protein